MFRFFSGIFGSDVGIDLGTCNTVIYVSGKGIVFNEPSVIAVKKRQNSGNLDIIAVGREASLMRGKTPQGVSTLQPLQDGVIANYEMTEALIRHFLLKVSENKTLSHSRVVISVPAEITEVERRSVIDATLGAGASEAYVVEEPIASALGVGLPIQQPRGSMILDMGGGTSEVAVISMGGVVVSNSIRSAGNSMDDAILTMLRQNHGLLVGETTAEQLKIELGSALPLDDEREIYVKGRDLANGLPKADKVSSVEVREAVNPIILKIEDMVKVALERTPPELSRDIVDQGVILTGGSCQLYGLSDRMARNLNSPVIVAEEPLLSVARGVGMILDNLDDMKKVLMSVNRSSL